MGKQLLPCTHSSLFFMGLYKLFEHCQNIFNMISRNISPVIKGFDTNNSPKDWDWGNWLLLRSSIDAYDMKKMIDGGSQLMIQVPKQPGVCVQVYNTLKELDLLKDPDGYKVTFEFDKDLDKNFSKWVNFLTCYESITQEFNEMHLLISTIAPMYQSPLQQYMEPKQIKDLTSSMGPPLNLNIIQRYCPDLKILKPSLNNKASKYYTWKSNEEYIEWKYNPQSFDSTDENKINLTDDALLHRIPWDTIHYFFSNIISRFRSNIWGVFIILDVYDMPFIESDNSIIETTVTQNILDKGYFYFSGLGQGYFPLYCECATVLEPGLGSKPLCYGMFLSDVCTNCSYLNECKGFNNYLYPSNLDFKAGNNFTILPEQIPSVEVGSKIRLLIKTGKNVNT